MQPYTTVHGTVALLDRSNVDTDQIIPKQFLKRIERSGFGEVLFFDWRYDDRGQPRAEFELNHPRAQGATILLARRNFGCGSSREHAVWALRDYGFRAVIAESFADIFYNNCFKNGILPIALDAERVDQLFRRAADDGAYALTIDLAQQTVRDPRGWETHFDVDPHRKECLLLGLDDIALTLRHAAAIEAFERARGDAPASP